LGSKANASSPFSSNLTEEIQVTAILQKMLQDNHIKGGPFYVSLPMKEIILRSFTIPFVKSDVIQDAIKFEAKKYMPFDLQDLSFVFYTIPFAEDQNKRLQVIFFAVRKEVLARYARIAKQVSAEISYCEPYMVSLTKALLFKKEIKPTDHLAFLTLDKNIGRICFIDQGIPQFIREFAVISPSQLEENKGTAETMNAKIVNEVGNSFDFYGRQFSGERIEQKLVSSDFVAKDLLNTLETEIKVKITKFSPVITTGGHAQSNDMDAIYAMGACVAPPMDALSGFNFLAGNKRKFGMSRDSMPSMDSYKEVLYVLLICVVLLAGIYGFLQMQLKSTMQQYYQLSAKQGAFLHEPMDNIQAETKQNIDLLAQYKTIRAKSDVAFILFKVASHLPQGALLTNLSLNYDQGDSDNAPVTIDMQGNVYREDPNEQIAVVNQIFSDFKNDRELSRFVKNVNLVSFNGQEYKGRKVTGFNIHCS
jgi:hypothetical protein